MNNNFEEFDIEKFKSNYCKDDEQIKKAEQILGHEIKQFYDHYIEFHYDRLKEIEADLLSTTFQDLLNCPVVNSMKSRVKNPYHFIDKLVRKVNRDVEYNSVTLENYHFYFDDLLGFRLIILYMNDWYKLHKLILEKYTCNQNNFCKKDSLKNFIGTTDSFLISLPEINIRNGDDEDIFRSKYGDSFEKNIILKKGRYYRSIHYSIFHKDYCFEIQLRSVFDEAWSEVDHDILYPVNLNSRECIEYSMLLNRITGFSNEMSSYFKQVIGITFTPQKGEIKSTLDSVPNELNHLQSAYNKSRHIEKESNLRNLSAKKIIDNIVKGENI